MPVVSARPGRRLLRVAGVGVHALAPGHGKTVMAAYLVGLRGTLRQAATIGATVTLTHTAGVLLPGLVLSTSRAVASERVYPWLGLGSGLLLAAVGIGLLVRARTGHGHPHPHGHEHHPYPHNHGHNHGHHQPQPLALQPALAMPGPPEGEPNRQGERMPASVHSPDHDHHIRTTTTTAAPPRGPGGRWGGGGWWRWAWLGAGAEPVGGGGAAGRDRARPGLARGGAGAGLRAGMAAALTGVGLLLARLRTRLDGRFRLPAGSLLTRAGRLVPVAIASVIVLVGIGLAAQGAARL